MDASERAAKLAEMSPEEIDWEAYTICWHLRHDVLKYKPGENPEVRKRRVRLRDLAERGLDIEDGANWERQEEQ